MQRSRVIAFGLAALLATGLPVEAAKKKKREEIGGLPPVLEESKRKKEKPVVTEVLDLPKDPPLAIVADAQRLGFYVSPLSNKGLLSQQTRDALRSLFTLARGGNFVNIRSFVAGTGDLRRVQTIISETFSDKRQPLPTVSVVQVGSLPLEGAQVIMEAIVVDKRTTAPHGLGLIAAKRFPAREAAGELKKSASRLNDDPSAIKKITCFLDSVESAATLRQDMAQSFPAASANYVQALRDSAGGGAACEAVMVARENSEKGDRVALVRSERVVFTGTQMAFGTGEADLRLAFDRLGKAVEVSGSRLKNVVFGRAYGLSQSSIAELNKLWPSYCPATPASTSLVFESLPSLDAVAGIEIVAEVE